MMHQNPERMPIQSVLSLNGSSGASGNNPVKFGRPVIPVKEMKSTEV